MAVSVGIVGLGLMGASLAWDFLKWPRCSFVKGFDINYSVLEKAKRKGLIHYQASSAAEAAEDVDLVFIATPVRSVPGIFFEIREVLSRETLVLDMGSTRGWIYKQIKPFLENYLYAGFHPMAGSEKGGFDEARAGLFKGAPVLITPFSPLGEKVVLIDEIVNFLGGKVFF
ncbi:MAG: cyclohexadieny/prephenate dehydrogenase [Candidatus Atribacteria bacterium]|jgi:prephenate dehydrogenase|uniref:prephenate dehydrogenase/arogenate dehydrogenase family protein n=1 Tax=Atrimonas thermophila TaxID=3064161 RepID=UPI0024AB20ED|nr:cyclohexadieny/prephenate dehydrogenase [Candidatus Atribacteria bacterium]MDI3530648.1 cyclohexadieny/prephenate dehydrogenase [Candidatus Atribacteria bacterium]